MIFNKANARMLIAAMAGLVAMGPSPIPVDSPKRRAMRLPHQGEREKERRRIQGFHTRHDHTMHEVSHRKFVRRCPVCDA